MGVVTDAFPVVSNLRAFNLPTRTDGCPAMPRRRGHRREHPGGVGPHRHGAQVRLGARCSMGWRAVAITVRVVPGHGGSLRALYPPSGSAPSDLRGRFDGATRSRRPALAGAAWSIGRCETEPLAAPRLSPRERSAIWSAPVPFHRGDQGGRVRRLLCLIAAVSLVAFTACGGTVVGAQLWGESSGIAVPDVSANDGADAVSSVEAEGLTATLADAEDDFSFDGSRDATGCEVRGQDPPAGELLPEGDEVTIRVSCAQVDWENKEGSGWEAFSEAYDSGFDDGCQALFDQSPDGSLYEDDYDTRLPTARTRTLETVLRRPSFRSMCQTIHRRRGPRSASWTGVPPCLRTRASCRSTMAGTAGPKRIARSAVPPLPRRMTR